ncbi:MAG: ubiquinone biosynthesis accessory factor UbiJ [Gammaproteobacteria bacterium]|nr:ubiquinone biosynthesis accessory factor UbiJ [Gammaproteobacteria bacterium]
MPATAPWLAAAEALFNRNIAASTEARSLARRLEGTSLQVEVEDRLRVRACVFNSGLALFSGEASDPAGGGPRLAGPRLAGPADATISGSAPALLQLLRGDGPSAASRVGVQIRGDAEIANLYRQLYAAAKPEFEEELSRWIGDMPARRLSEVARSVRSWARRTRRTAGENIAEYLQEEGRDLISKTEHEEFIAGVDAVRESADRIEARLKNLEQRIKDPS